MKKVLVVGSLNMDLVTRVHKTPRVGETVSGQGLHQNPGGKGANQAVALGKLGAQVHMAGKVGNDAYGLALKQNLAEMNVSDLTEMVDHTGTGLAFIMVNDDADNSIVVIEGANGQLMPEDVKPEWFDGVDYVITQHEIPMATVNQVIQMAKEKGIITVHNPAPVKPLSPETLKGIDYLVLNETEFEALTGFPYEGEKDLRKGLQTLQVGAILLTLGSAGARFDDGVTVIGVPALKVEAVDTTAAGDSFIGGFVYALSNEKTIEEAMQFATQVAAYTVTKLGAQSALPYMEDLIKTGGRQ